MALLEIINDDFIVKIGVSLITTLMGIALLMAKSWWKQYLDNQILKNDNIQQAFKGVSDEVSGLRDDIKKLGSEMREEYRDLREQVNEHGNRLNEHSKILERHAEKFKEK